MEAASLLERTHTAGTPRVERRDLTSRALRSAVAAWFSIHPAELATLSDVTVERMALRLEGRRVQRALDAGDVCRVPQRAHPWAG